MDLDLAFFLFKLNIVCCFMVFMHYRLADRGHTVVGVDCSSLGVEAFFTEHSLEFTRESITELNDGFLYKVCSYVMHSVKKVAVNKVLKIVHWVMVRTVFISRLSLSK